MEPNTPYRPRVSRETRLLLTAGVLAVATLWLLARVRFQDLPATPNPITPVLSQLAGGWRYEDLAAQIAQLQPRLEGRLISLDPGSAASGSLRGSDRIAALRLREDLAVALLPTGARADDARLVARDRASGLSVVRVPGQPSGFPPVPWTPRRPQQPRYLVASDLSIQGVSLRPVFVGSLELVESPWWPDGEWTVPEHNDLAPGSFLFTTNAELVGMVIGRGVERTIVAGATLLAEVERLLATPMSPGGTIGGVDVQILTEALASVTGASAGVVVSWVEPGGAAAKHLMVGDVIEAADGRPLTSPQQWDAHVARLSVGQTLAIRIRRAGELRETSLVAMPAAEPPADRPLGLTLRARTGMGAEVIRVAPGSAADRARLTVGDVITLIGAVPSPTPTQVAATFRSVPEGQRVMIGVTRGDTHQVTALER